MKFHSGRNDKSRDKSAVSKRHTGKIRKNKKLNSVSSSIATSNGVQSMVKSVKTDPDRKPSNKVIAKKVKLLKKKFGATLNAGGVLPQNVNKSGKKDRTTVGIRFKQKAKRKKRKVAELKDEEGKEEVGALPVSRFSDDPIPKKTKWTNRQRVLVFGCRGISTRDRHLMKDLRKLLPHSRPENKMERRENMTVVNEMCEMKHCNKCMLFEGRANRDVYMWLSSIPNGPSAKFLLQNIYTMDELRFTGNCLVGSRPILSFDDNFEKIIHYNLIKELLTQVFGTPNYHPKSQPFFDHVFTFSVVDKRIWFRNYQILSEDGAVVEIGPRFVMNPIKIFNGSFGGETIWENPFYVTPAKYRTQLKKLASGKYLEKIDKKAEAERRPPLGVSYKLPTTDEVFTDNTWEKAKELVSNKTEVGGPLQTKGKKKKQKEQEQKQQQQQQKKKKKRKFQKDKKDQGKKKALQSSWTVQEANENAGE